MRSPTSRNPQGLSPRPPKRAWTLPRAPGTIFFMHRSAACRLAVALLALAVCLTPVFAQASRAPEPGDAVIVRLTTGETIYGELVSRDARNLVLRVSGVETTIQTQHVERVTKRRTPEERYRSMRAIIDDEDSPRLILLCEWLIEQGLLTEARAELDAVLDREPANPDAARLSRILDQRITLRERSERARPAPAEDAEERRRPRVQPPGHFEPGAFPLLTDEQVNLLKVYELDLRDPPRLLIERDTTERFLNAYSGAAGLPRTENERKDFFQRKPEEILELMFRLRARELYPEVRVLDLPESLALFRDNVAGTWLTRNCASTSCHGGTDAPPPHLFNKRPFSETTALTNFIIIDRFRLDDGSPLIDYERPGDSPLLQLGLPRPMSAVPHPETKAWRPAFRTRDVTRFRQAIEWIDAMIRPRPDTPIEYKPIRLDTDPPEDTEQPEEPPADQPR